MDAVLDTIWEKLAAGFIFLADSFYLFLENFHFLGPLVLITILGFFTVWVTKLLSKIITTKRYTELEKKFNHWVEIREEAMRIEDREEARRLARNIDQAKLNKAYYDYFFEGLMLGIARRIIPIFFMFGFINEFYRSERLEEIFGRPYVLQIPSSSGEPLMLGAVFWYIISLFIGYLLWFVISRRFRKTSCQGQKLTGQPAREGS
jgi:uncharacterized membrane protein (DUF106 family)